MPPEPLERLIERLRGNAVDLLARYNCHGIRGVDR